MKYTLSLLFFLCTSLLFAQDTTNIQEEVTINEFISGSLTLPPSTDNLVIMLQGSGPTDRDGNQPFMKNDSFKKLSQGLTEEGIATYRYDKRIRKAVEMGISEEDMRFDDFITDAIAVLEYFNGEERFRNITVLGHSQGSLVGMLAAKDRADAFISIAGAGQPLDSLLVNQIGLQMPNLTDNVRQSLKELRQTGSTNSYNPMLASIFRPSIQPFLLSWIKYNPATEIAELEIPVLLINGTNDLQVSPAEAEILQKANPEAELVLLQDMNHVLRKIESQDMLENSKSYNEPGLPLHPELVPGIVAFIKSLE